VPFRSVSLTVVMRYAWSNDSTQEDLKVNLLSIRHLLIAGIFSVLICWLSAFGSSNYDLSAEGLNSFAFIRMSQGKPFATRINEIPLHFCIFTFLFLGVIGGAYVLAEHLWGEVFSQNILPCMLGRLRHFDMTFLPVLKGLIIDLLFWNSAFFLLAWTGFKIIWKSSANKHKSICLALAISLSFFCALVGQFREGAAFNYFAGCFFLLSIPVALALTQLFQHTGLELKKYWVVFFFLVTTFSSARLGLQNVFGNHAKTPFADISDYISENFLTEPVYTNTGNLALFLHNQVWLGPSVESNLDLCRGLDQVVPQIKEKLRAQPFQAAVIYGDSCADWHPSGFFREELEPLKSLKKTFGRVCIFEK